MTRAAAMLLLPIAGWLAVPTRRPAAAAEPVRLTSLKTIWIPQQADSAEQSAAKMIQECFEALYGVRLETAVGGLHDRTGGVFVGRAPALRSGTIAEAELERVRHDGYVIKADGGRIVLSGYDRAGTRYAAAELLRRLGMRWYPWKGARDGVAEVRPAKPSMTLQPLALSVKPFYEHRDLISHVRPEVFGTTFRAYRMGDPSQAANPELFSNPAEKRPKGYTPFQIDAGHEWVGWCHTAPYLVPRDLYYGAHPEYFAMYDGKRIEPSAYARMAICETNPDARFIAVRRAIEWVELQNDRRFFHVDQADARLCACPQCRQANPIPDYATDRVLNWTNTIARAVAEKHPDKTIVSLAYMETVKPPLHIQPESNVLVMYCPWLWNSRASSHVSFDHPVNVIAMKELAGWVLWGPGRVGVYDYAYGDCAYGTAQRIKMYARLGVNHIHFNGASDDRLHWIGSQLMWDPLQDIEPLNDQFVQGYYGPAAGPMGELLALEQEAVDRYLVRRRSPFDQIPIREAAWWRRYCQEVRDLSAQAANLGESADELVRIRVLADACRHLLKVLAIIHPAGGAVGLRASPEQYKNDLAAAARLAQRVLQACRRPDCKYLLQRYQDELEKPLEAVGVTIQQKTAPTPPTAAQQQRVLQPQMAQVDDLLKKAMLGAANDTEERTVTVRFDAADEADKWIADGTQADLITAARSAGMPTAGGRLLRGVCIDAPLSKLPLVPRDNIRIHAGRLYLERTLDKPLAADRCHSISLHLYATRDVPATFYTNQYRADFELHAGEQVIRMDARNFAEYKPEQPLEINTVALDIWPQDNFYPYPAAQDVSVTVLSLSVSNREPSPATLPDPGKAIWLSAFRPNVPNEPPHAALAAACERADLLRRTKQKGSSIDRFLPRRRERFRTWTSCRTVSPIVAILTGGDASCRPAAETLQDCLQQASQVRLPIDPEGLSPGPHVGNVILVGPKACQSAGWVRPEELAYVGSGGFVIHAWQGRTALAGADAEGTAAAVQRYLEDHNVRLFGPGVVQVADLRGDFLHELYTLDRPWFENRPAWLAWRPHNRTGSAPPSADADLDATLRLADAIKDLARRGEHHAPAELLRSAEASAMLRCVAAQLLRNPFLDARRMTRRYAATERDRQ